MPVMYVAVGIVLVVLLVVGTLLHAYKKVPPNQAMIVYGFGGKKVVQGGGAFVFPGLQSYRTISMSLMSFDVVPTQEMYSHQGIAINVEAVAQVKITSDRASILTASEQFLDQPDDEREAMILHSIEGHLRGIIGQLSVEGILKSPDEINSKMRETSSEDLGKMGLEVVSFTIKRVQDHRGYIENLGVPEIERVKKDAAVAKAQAERDIAIQQAQANKESTVAKAQARQTEVEAETQSQTKQAEYEKSLNIKRAEYEIETNTRKAEADLAYDLQKKKTEQQITEQQVRIEQVKAESEVKVKEAQIALKEKELQATIVKPAEAERQAVELKAEADKLKKIREAEAQAESIRQTGLADAAAEQAKGEAKANVIKLEGLSEAEALQKKAEAYQAFTQAAITVEFLKVLPELAEKIAQPLSNVGNITVVSQDGASAGVSKLTGDLATIMAQLPALAQSLTGVDLKAGLGRLVGGGQKEAAATTAPALPETPSVKSEKTEGAPVSGKASGQKSTPQQATTSTK